MDPIEIPTYAPDLMPGYDPTVIRPLQGAGVVGFIRPDIITTTGDAAYLTQTAYGIPITEVPDTQNLSVDQDTIKNPDLIERGETPYPGETFYNRDLLIGHTMFTEAPQLYIRGPRTPQPLIVAPIAAAPAPAPEKKQHLIPVQVINPVETKASTATAPTSLTVKYSTAAPASSTPVTNPITSVPTVTTTPTTTTTTTTTVKK